jgi:hypothetical protein
MLVLAFAILAPACAETAFGPPPAQSGDPIQVALVSADSEVDLHESRLLAATDMSQVAAEMTRHADMMPGIYDEVRAEANDFAGCPDAATRAALESILNGLEATERGYNQAIGTAHLLDEVRKTSQQYTAGIKDLIGRLEDGWATCD